MSSKQRRPLDDPPSAASSSEEEDIVDSDEEEEVSEDEKEPPQTQQIQQTQQQQSRLNPKPVDCESSSEEDAETESESEDLQGKKKSPEKKKPIQPESSEEPTDSYSIKPIAASKVVDDDNIPLSKSSAKRKPENGKVSKPKKVKPTNEKEKEKEKEKVKGEKEGVVSDKVEKKSSFTRFWTEEDEIAILKGLIDFQSKMGKDPITNQVEFCEFIKNNVHVQVEKGKVMDKIRRLKKKFMNLMEKSVDGGDPVIPRAHEYRCYHLSKKIWGNVSSKNANNNKALDVHAKDYGSKVEKSGVKSAKKSKPSDEVVPSVVPADNGDDQNKEDVELKGDKIEPNEEKDENIEESYPLLMNAFSTDYVTNAIPGINFLKKNMKYVKKSELKEFENAWKEFYVEETEIGLRRMSMLHEQAKKMIDGVKSTIQP